MKAVLPGKPEPRLQALATGFWESQRVIVGHSPSPVFPTTRDWPPNTDLDWQVYITGNALAILGDHETLIQTIYDDDETPLEAVAFDETTGCIAACTDCIVRVYQPLSVLDGVLQVWAVVRPWLQSLPELPSSATGT